MHGWGLQQLITQADIPISGKQKNNFSKLTRIRNIGPGSDVMNFQNTVEIS